MFNQSTQSIIIFTVSVVILLLFFCIFIVNILYRFQQKKNQYYKELDTLKIKHENALLKSQLEMQENTFQKISTEIHDNIGQKLSLAKLYLNTISDPEIIFSVPQIKDSVEIISEVINDLSDIAHSLSSDIILNEGLVKGVELEVKQLKKTCVYDIDLAITGDSVFFEFEKELILFRIVQEALQNIMKHSEASAINIRLHYNSTQLTMVIKDNGKGFVIDEKRKGVGLINIQRRTSILKGDFSIQSGAAGTEIIITIPK